MIEHDTPRRIAVFGVANEDSIAWHVAQGLKQLETLNQQMNGALLLYLKQHSLEGNWRLAANGRELERLADPVPAA